MFKWKVSLTSRGSKKSDKLNNAKSSAAASSADPPDEGTENGHDSLERSGVTMKPPFSPVLSRGGTGGVGGGVEANNSHHHQQQQHQHQQQQQHQQNVLAQQQAHGVPQMQAGSHHQYYQRPSVVIREENAQFHQQPTHAQPQQPPQPQQAESHKDPSQSWNEWTQQLLAYTAWVNSQLRKRSELRLVQDMGNDLQDGVLVAKLIEIITNKEIRGIDMEAKSIQAKRDNFEKILTFLATQRVRTSTITSRDLAAGNLKSLMRLILILASHYKPNSVQQGRDSAAHRGSSQTTPNLNVVSNRRFNASMNDTSMSHDEADLNTNNSSTRIDVNGFATLRRQNTTAGTNNRRPTLGGSTSTSDLLSPSVQRRFTVTSTPHREKPQAAQQQQSNKVLHFATISNARSLANLTGGNEPTSLTDNYRLGPSTSAVDLSSSHDEETSNGVRSGQSNARKKPSATIGGSVSSILKKDSKYGSRRELPALGVSGVVSKGRPSIFEFWENMQQQPPPQQSDDPPGAAEPPAPSLNETPSDRDLRSSMRRLLPALPATNGPSSLTVYTGHNGVINHGNHSGAEPSPATPVTSSETLGSRGEVEGSSNQPSPTCVANEIDQNYWNAVNSSQEKSTAALRVHEMLVDDLNRTKKQLAELHRLLLANQESQTAAHATMTTESKGTTTTHDSDDPDGAISWLRSKLHTVDQRCNTLQSDLKKAQQDCATLDGNRRGLAACLANQEEALNSLRQELLRTTLANQSLTNEKVELMRKLEEKDRQIADLRRQLAAKDRVMETQRIVLEEAAQSFSPALRAKLDKNMSTIDARRNQYREELQVAREALSSLRTNFRSNDPNHHTLDTLEQCMAFLLERIAGPDHLDPTPQTSVHQRTNNDSSGGMKRMPITSLHGFHGDQFTKVVYFTERTVTPYLTVIPRRLGEITLRDFKTLFDRPGVFRFHFKAPDAEYGFVKEEIADDNVILPGFDGKIIAWVEEIQV